MHCAQGMYASDLVHRHRRQILARPASLRRRMQSVWGAAFRPGSYSDSFFGHELSPLGRSILTVQVDAGDHTAPGPLCVLGLKPRINPDSAEVIYDTIRLRHELQRRPREEARGPVLDPRPDAEGGDGSWLQMALDVDRARKRAAQGRTTLPSIPRLPPIYFGYSAPEKARLVVTPTLVRLAVDLLASSSGRKSVAGSGQAAEQQAAFDALPPLQQERLLRTAWESSFLSPSAPENGTGQWLLPQELCVDLENVLRVYEDFRPLLGRAVYNPARDLLGAARSNPALEVATAARIDLPDLLKRFAMLPDGDSQAAAIEEQVLSLLPAYRRRLGASAETSDGDLLSALCDFGSPVAVLSRGSGSEAEQIALMRAELPPHVAVCCTDDDLLLAYRHPQLPLRAAGLCQVQVLRRDLDQPLDEALSFGPADLRRERLSARLWSWSLTQREHHVPLDTRLAVAV